MVTTPEQENISAIVAKARVAHKLKKWQQQFLLSETVI